MFHTSVPYNYAHTCVQEGELRVARGCRPGQMACSAGKASSQSGESMGRVTGLGSSNENKVDSPGEGVA